MEDVMKSDLEIESDARDVSDNSFYVPQPAASQSPPAAGQSLPPTDLQSAVARLGG
jgi:hypothetical protein